MQFTDWEYILGRSMKFCGFYPTGFLLGTALLVMGCGTSGGAMTSPSSSPVYGQSRPAILVSQQPISENQCAKVTIAIDPGHNPVPINRFDPVTGAAQIDYSNGAEDQDVFRVASIVKEGLERDGYRVVLLKRTVSESVSYRERVTRAERADALFAMSIHTSPGANQVFPQRVGLYRQGTGANGTQRRVVFVNEATASHSLRYSTAVARGRAQVQGTPVTVTDNSFDGRPPLWEGNIPIISLISDRVPWVYNEFGTATAGGSIALPDGALREYAAGLIAGVRLAAPLTRGGCSSH
ncbi:N-acetylmuramoyl-L-alanine amidase [Gordonia sp. VNK1]|uniref:N-acetylmuramoyl-L-alanine amidase n=1 Tax=Gordonia oleivorans TaxID=3156618 RepID=UPI0032B41410